MITGMNYPIIGRSGIEYPAADNDEREWPNLIIHAHIMKSLTQNIEYYK